MVSDGQFFALVTDGGVRLVREEGETGSFSRVRQAVGGADRYGEVMRWVGMKPIEARDGCKPGWERMENSLLVLRFEG
ncbi:hypothetical protein IF1G_03371 [Cordyceps javanica]|uniref:Uncharacterized protein n=1 Tax=Cordyceps javanica TaxID=43265 RepID=A0A545W5B6_9HYPO|nr:hypothetical protein IF1G_03371 [Cordyceps javanica]TQW09193.1 hypothetical protein IF2G_03624 [Cordyceps javanica]